jgi:hypothetical protein
MINLSDFLEIGNVFGGKFYCSKDGRPACKIDAGEDCGVLLYLEGDTVRAHKSGAKAGDGTVCDGIKDKHEVVAHVRRIIRLTQGKETPTAADRTFEMFK